MSSSSQKGPPEAQELGGEGGGKKAMTTIYGALTVRQGLHQMLYRECIIYLQ